MFVALLLRRICTVLHKLVVTCLHPSTWYIIVVSAVNYDGMIWLNREMIFLVYRTFVCRLVFAAVGGEENFCFIYNLYNRLVVLINSRKIILDITG